MDKRMTWEEDEYWASGVENVASSCECTGLIQTPPQSEEEYESYQELYSMEAPPDPEDE